MRKYFATFIVSILLARLLYLHADVNGIGSVSSLPGTCSVGSLTYLTTGTVGLYYCSPTDTWTIMAAPQSQVPANAIVLINSGTCPTGFAEVTTLDGKTLFGTINAHGDVGGTGGNDSITPTVATLTAAAQTITGSTATESAHTHTLTPLGSNAATATTGNCAATNVAIGTGATSACKATAPNLTVPAETFTGSTTTTAGGSAHSHTVGTLVNGTSAVTGTLNSFDNRSAYTKVIFCKKS